MLHWASGDDASTEHWKHLHDFLTECSTDEYFDYAGGVLCELSTRISKIKRAARNRPLCEL